MSDEAVGEDDSHSGNGRSGDVPSVGADPPLTLFRFTSDIEFEATDLHDAFGMIAAHFIALQLEMSADDVTAGRDWFSGVLRVGPVDAPEWEEET